MATLASVPMRLILSTPGDLVVFAVFKMPDSLSRCEKTFVLCGFDCGAQSVFSA
jgi:hypothetical protein